MAQKKFETDQSGDIQVEDNGNEENNELLTGMNGSSKSSFLAKFLSLRAVIIVLIVLLILVCCSMVWLASFIGSSNAINYLTRELLSNAKFKVIQFIDTQLTPYQQIGKTLADEYNSDLLPYSNLTFMRSYLYSKYVNYKPTSIGYYLAYPYSSINTYIERGTGSKIDLLYGQQVNNWPGYNLYVLNKTSNSFIWQNPSALIPYNVKSLDYWNTSMTLFSNYNTDEVFAPPYLTLFGDIALFYAIKVYTPSLYKQGVKELNGIVKINIGIVALQTFLKNITLIGNGYVLLCETNNNVIGGSINTTAFIPSNRLSMFELTDKNSGELMTKVHATYGDDLPAEFYINVNGEGYLISCFMYTFMNIKWKAFLILYESDISRTTNINTGISIGVTGTCLVIGLVMSILIGYFITKPLVYLQNQFKLIKKFELHNVKFTNSNFKEVDSILSSLKEMVSWLHEFKAFIPEHVFSQLKDVSDTDSSSSANNQKVQKSKIVPTTDQDESKHDLSASYKSELHSSSNSQRSMHRSSHHQSHYSNKDNIAKKGLFALGYHHKECAIISIKLRSIHLKMPNEVAQLFSKIANSLSSITKSLNGDLQFLSINEIQITLTKASLKNSINYLAFDCSLKISKSLNTILGNEFNIGVSCGKAHVGNVGTSTLRYYSILGSIVDESKQLLKLAELLNVKIVTSENSSKDLTSFILKPIDRMKLSDSDKIQTVFEVVKDSTVNDDEWLYELAQKNENLAHSEFLKAFSIFGNGTDINNEELNDLFEKGYSFYNEYYEKNPNDQSVSNILSIYDNVRQELNHNESLNNLLTNYYSNLQLKHTLNFK